MNLIARKPLCFFQVKVKKIITSELKFSLCYSYGAYIMFRRRAHAFALLASAQVRDFQFLFKNLC